MDKYDRQAAEIVFKHFGAKAADMSLAAVIAAALRESAAEAFEEAGLNWHSDEIANLHWMNARAAALRSTTRGKGA